MNEVKVTPVTSFTIDRKTWLQGEGSDESYLFRSRDGKQCCLGFYMEACAVPRQKITSVMTPMGLRLEFRNQVPNWLFNEDHNNISDVCNILMRVNDLENENPSDKEKRIALLFKQAGIEVTFTGEY
jgi:hypothetical protein